MMELGFYLKKTVSYFVEPFGMTIALFAIGLYFLLLKREKFSKIFLTLSFSVMILYSYPPFSNFLVEKLENQYPKYDYAKNVKYIHVLGNGHNTDSDQPLSSQISSAGVKRDLEGILIHLNMQDSKLIFTGFGGSTNISNAKMNAKLASSLGVKDENIIIGETPKDTKEEALFAKSVVKDEAFILVTSATHMPRAMMLFKSVGLNPIPAPTNFYKNKDESLFVLPTICDFGKSQIAMHEYIGMLWSKLRG